MYQLNSTRCDAIFQNRGSRHVIGVKRHFRCPVLRLVVAAGLCALLAYFCSLCYELWTYDALNHFTFVWACIVTHLFIIKPTACTNLTNVCWYETLHVSDSSCLSAYSQYSAMVYVIQVCRQLSSKTRMELFYPGLARRSEWKYNFAARFNVHAGREQE